MTPDEMKELKELIEFLKENDIGEFEFERGDFKVRIKFGQPAQATRRFGSRYCPSGAVVVPRAACAARLSRRASMPWLPLVGGCRRGCAARPKRRKLHIVKSPIVGTFYESSSPGAPAFVKIGDEIESGQVLCIVEAMKLMNEIESDAAGEVVKRLVTNGQPVEYGQPLFALRLH